MALKDVSTVVVRMGVTVGVSLVDSVGPEYRKGRGFRLGDPSHRGGRKRVVR